MNYRTDMLIAYVNAIKLRNKKRDRVDKLKIKSPNSPEIEVAKAEEAKVLAS